MKSKPSQLSDNSVVTLVNYSRYFGGIDEIVATTKK